MKITTTLLLTGVLVLTLTLLSSHGYAKTLNLEVTGDMTYNDQYYFNMGVLQNVNNGDIVIIRINSPGGLVAVLRDYQAALTNKKIFVETRVSGMAASAAAMLVCISNKRVVLGNAKLLFHMPFMLVTKNINLPGQLKPVEIEYKVPASTFDRTYLENTIQQYCTDLVPTKILDKLVFNDYQYWITAKQANQLKRR